MNLNFKNVSALFSLICCCKRIRNEEDHISPVRLHLLMYQIADLLMNTPASSKYSEKVKHLMGFLCAYFVISGLQVFINVQK